MAYYFRNQYRIWQRRKSMLAKADTLSYLYPEGSNRNNGELLLFKAEMDECLDRIGDDFSLPVKLSSEGYPYREITEQMGLPLNTLKSRIHSGRKKLRAILK